jgi:hypothetical protein
VTAVTGAGDGTTPQQYRAWLRAIVASVLIAFVVAVLALSKAADQGGIGLQVTMVAVTSVVLVGGLLLLRRWQLSRARGVVTPAPLGQHVLWLAFIRTAAFAAVVLSAIGVVRSTDVQSMAAIMLVVALWVLSIAIRLDGTARRAADTEQPT